MRAFSTVFALLLLSAGPAVALDLTPAGERPVVADFKLPTLKGKRARLADTRGKVTVVTFWATWCKPCKQELPFLSKLGAAHDDVEILAINTDGPDTRSQVRRLVKSKKLKMPVLLDPDGNLTQRLNPRKQMPLTLFIDASGRLAATKEGFASGDEKTITAMVDRLRAEGGQATP